jgi:hypothetical protein
LNRSLLTSCKWVRPPYAGFHNRPPTADDLERGCTGKTFLSFDDDAYDDTLREWLSRRFPEPSPWER